MGKVSTSAIFYRRGIPNNQAGFGAAVQGNYSIVQPQYLFNVNRSVKKQIPSTVPSAPSIVSANYSSGIITVTFTQGSNGGSPITNYLYLINSPSYLPCSPAQTTSPLSISQTLSPGAHSIQIKAINAVGQSNPSSTITFSV
jgi:hypothetical protein